MFTGLIQAVGRVHQRGRTLVVEGCDSFSPLVLGESVAVDGVCLTVSTLTSKGFVADVSEETIKRTNLLLKAQNGRFVNLERALRLSDRLGGHLVSGHIDGLGEVVAIKELKNSWKIELRWEDSKFAKYICEKASITLNGISLTVSEYYEEGARFDIAVIPHTWANTSLNYLGVGELVNLEADLIAKYTERLLKVANLEIDSSKKNKPSEISKDWLSSHGWA